MCPISAGAADLGRGRSIKDDPPPPPREEYPEPFYNWGGFYGGVFVGGTNEIWTVELERNGNRGSAEVSSGGVAFGGYAGYNLMLTPRFMIGVEGDIGHSSGSQNDVVFDNVASLSSIGTFGSIRGRYGYAIDRFMVYGTAGLAFASVTNELLRGAGAAREITHKDELETGFAVGGGLEYALAANIVARAEYLYANYGTISVRNLAGDVAELTNEMHQVRVGLSYRF